MPGPARETAAREPSGGRAPQRASGRPRASSHPLHGLQSSVGNRAVGQLVAGRSGRMQLGAEGSAHEGAADRIADAVVAGRPVRERPGRARSGSAPVPHRVEGEIERARGDGRPLPGSIRGHLQRALSADLSRVRLHTGDRAHAITRGVGAEAAATGHDIFFRHGAYRPDTPRGLHTLTHEVAHTLQTGRSQRLLLRRVWEWKPPYKKTAPVAWRAGRDVGDHLIDDIGEGKKVGDTFDDVTRMYTDYRWAGAREEDKHFVPSPELKARTEDYEGRRAKAQETLRGCTTLSGLAGKLDAAGYNFSTVPSRYIEATAEYKTFKKKKTFLAGTRAVLACRLALRDIDEGTTLDKTSAAKYMGAARAREETLTKSVSFIGDYKWAQFEGVEATDFGKWAMGKGSEPTTTKTMNCWESVLFAAYKAGHVGRDRIKEKYIESKAISGGGRPSAPGHVRPDGVDRGEDIMVPIEQLLVKGAPKKYDPHDPNTVRPMKGDIVVKGTFGSHVMIAEGNMDGVPDVISCWPQYTGDDDKVRRQPLTDFMGRGLGESSILMYRPFWG